MSSVEPSPAKSTCDADGFALTLERSSCNYIGNSAASFVVSATQLFWSLARALESGSHAESASRRHLLNWTSASRCREEGQLQRWTPEEARVTSTGMPQRGLQYRAHNDDRQAG